jgi:hypothetical protein
MGWFPWVGSGQVQGQRHCIVVGRAWQLKKDQAKIEFEPGRKYCSDF